MDNPFDPSAPGAPAGTDEEQTLAGVQPTDNTTAGPDEATTTVEASTETPFEAATQADVSAAHAYTTPAPTLTATEATASEQAPLANVADQVASATDAEPFPTG
ncbi:MAG TPA: hypothetical protein VE338_10255, partial [Ktedonobacterales bacterium]|nr:hypothetical protein [Ktedonobacterales bacterium]